MIAGMFWNSGFSSLASITKIVTLSTTWKEDVDVCGIGAEFIVYSVSSWRCYLALSICDADEDVDGIFFLGRR